jgi:uridylate kinase
MDSTAFTHARDAELPIRVFSAASEGNISRAIAGDDIGTLVHA